MRHWLRTFTAALVVILATSVLYLWAAPLTGPTGRNVVFTATNTLDIGGFLMGNILTLHNQTVDPSPPVAGDLYLYQKAGSLFTRDPAGTIAGIGAGGGSTGPGFVVARVATSANITLSGEQSFEGITTSASVVLVKNQSTASQNGLYTSSSSTWARLSTYDASAEFTAGVSVYVQDGISAQGQKDTVWHFAPVGAFTLGTTAITFVKTGLGPTGELIAQKNAASGYLGLRSDGNALSDRIGSPAVQAALSAATPITVTARQMGIEGSGGPVNLTANPQIVAGTRDGTEVTLIGIHATNTVTLDNGTGLRLCGNTGSVVVGLNGSKPSFRWNAGLSVWEQTGCLSWQDVAQTGRTVVADETLPVKVCNAAGTSCASKYIDSATGIPTEVATCLGGNCDHIIRLSPGKDFFLLKHDSTLLLGIDNDTGTFTGLPAGTRTTSFPMKLSTVQVTDGNAYIDTIDGTNIDYSGLRLTDGVIACGFYTHKIVPDLAAVPSWNVLLTLKALTGAGGNAVWTITAKDFANNATLDAALTGLITSTAMGVQTSANLTLTTTSGGSYDATEPIAAGNLLIVKVCREASDVLDTVGADLLLMDVSARYNVN